jgi:hypothetical protein
MSGASKEAPFPADALPGIAGARRESMNASAVRGKLRNPTKQDVSRQYGLACIYGMWVVYGVGAKLIRSSGSGADGGGQR